MKLVKWICRSCTGGSELRPPFSFAPDDTMWFHFGGPRPAGGARSGAAQPRGRTTSIHVVELSVIDGKLIPGDPNQATYIDLKPVHEEGR